jgi:energy-coupling factor transporter ATP-binding protein EcfA2
MPAPEIIGKSWDQFLDDFRGQWEPGQHIAIIAPTGQGKTTVLVTLLELRNFVLGFDPKGGDDTLAKTKFPRLASWPPPAKAYDKMAKREPVKYLVGPKIAKLAQRPQLIAVQAAALIGAWDDGGWTVAIDELQIAADKMGQADDIDNLLIAARTKKVSVVSLFQRPADVPRAAYQMASWIFLGLTLDVDTINRLAEIVGRPKYEIRGAVNGLARVDYSWLIVPNNPRRPMVLTLPREPEKSPSTQPAGRVGSRQQASETVSTPGS